MRLLIDNKDNQDANNIFLPQTDASQGLPATGGSIKVDSVTVYTNQKGKAIFDLSQLTYPHSVYSVALVKTSSTSEIIYDGVSSDSDNEWINSTEAITSLISEFSTTLNAVYPQFEVVQDGDNLVIQTNSNTRNDNDTEFTLYIKSVANYSHELEYDNIPSSYSGSYGINVNGTVCNVSIQYSDNVSVTDVLEYIAAELNGNSFNHDSISGSVVEPLPPGYTASISGTTTLVITEDNTSAILSLSVTPESGQSGGLTLLGVENPSGNFEDVQLIQNGEDRNTTNIKLDYNSINLASLIQGDFDSTTTSIELMMLLRDKINSQSDFAPDGVKLVANETETIYANTVGGVGDNLNIIFNGQTVTIIDTSDNKLNLLGEINTAITNNFTAIASEVDETGFVPVLKITADGTKDLGNGIFKLTSTISEYSTTASGDPKTEFPFDVNLSLRTTEKVDTYNDGYLSINVAGDGNVSTSGMSPLSGGGSNALTPMLRSLTKGRGCQFEGATEQTLAGLNIAGFGGFIMVGEEPNEILTQSDVFSLEANHLVVDSENGLGWSVRIRRIEENDRFFVATFPLTSEFAIENDEEKVFAIEIERVGSVCNFYIVRFNNPIKTETEGWNVLYRNQLGSLPYTPNNVYRFLYLNSTSDKAYIYNISNEVYVMNKITIDATLALSTSNSNINFTPVKDMLTANKWTLPHILSNDGASAKLTMIRAEGN
jgi:hypothetical protein